MTCFADPVSTPAARTTTLRDRPELDRIRERVLSGHYDSPEVLSELADRLVCVVRDPKA